ncbi:hypothetical protein QWY97_18140 [Vibrio cortegadensis]|uniref:hypothetical protein n=1 Tax=Vibrio cortegadensis TaxID=1328770 RepID=UPI0021C26E16|nr:hypothetical protein [Vibrio cortegadensis]MDN3699248.1 hypothetical protein [Vibrio cortegadensis]
MEIKDYFYAIGIVVTAIISIFNIVNNHKNSKKTSFINTVTSERVKWLDKLRQNISDFCGLTHTWTRMNKTDIPECTKILGEIDKLRYLIRLQLNPKKEKGIPNADMIIENLISKIPELTDISKREELDSAMAELIVKSQELLKDEWEKVKLESKNGEIK